MPNRSPWWVALALVAACGERERLTFPTEIPSDHVGPITVILEPAEDTVLTAGDAFVLGGQSFDVDGVDSVFFDLSGTNLNFSPLAGNGANTVDFGLQIPTSGHAGTTILVRIHAVDIAHNQGDVVERRLFVE
jgi:hypothetical protein